MATVINSYLHKHFDVNKQVYIHVLCDHRCANSGRMSNMYVLLRGPLTFPLHHVHLGLSVLSPDICRNPQMTLQLWAVSAV